MTDLTKFLRPGRSDEHYTPPDLFAALGVRFDLDPASPGLGSPDCVVPCDRAFTKEDDGLAQEWSGFVWLNPPFGARNGVVPWLDKFFAHGNGIVLVNAFTSSGWFQEYAAKANAMLLPKGKTKFVQPGGVVAKSPPFGVALLSAGGKGTGALFNAAASGYGLMCFPYR